MSDNAAMLAQLMRQAEQEGAALVTLRALAEGHGARFAAHGRTRGVNATRMTCPAAGAGQVPAWRCS